MRPTQFRSSGSNFKASSVRTRRPPCSDSALGRAWQFRRQFLQVCAVLPRNCLPTLAKDEKRQASECGSWSCLHGNVLRSSCSTMCWFYPQISTTTAGHARSLRTKGARFEPQLDWVELTWPLLQEGVRNHIFNSRRQPPGLPTSADGPVMLQATGPWTSTGRLPSHGLRVKGC